PPTVSATAAPTANASGFARGPVTVAITAVSPSGPGVRSVTYTTSGALAIPTTIVAGSTAQITVDADGETDVDSYATDLSGTNSPTLRTVVKVDRSAPAITCAAPAPGWHLDNITVACTATGSLSGLADLTQAAFNLRTNVAAGTETANAATDSVSVCNRVGNCATAGPLTGIKIDRAAPSISITTPAGTYTAGQLVLADYTCSDSGSGVSTCAGPVAKGAPIDTNAAGPHTFTVTASDAVGNQSQAVMTYTVVARACDEERDAAGGADCNSDENNLINKVHPPKPPKAPAVGRTADHQDDHRDGHGKSKKSSSESGDGEGG
ncbi:MAG: hypothetical protein M3Z13_07765, partial [Candidatus Dormibacteraeota bacterium]|nr:hypothetical protein [Candidatus Dormibacteraeota bacterium]